MPRAVLHEPVLYEFGGELINILSHTSQPLGRTITPGLGAATQTWKVQDSPSQAAAQGSKGAKKGKKKEKRKKKKGLLLTPAPGLEPQLVKEVEESKTLAPVVKEAVALDWGGKDDGFNDILHDEPKAEEVTESPPRKTEVKARAQPKKGRRKGHGGKKGHRKGAVPSSKPSLI